MNASPPTLNREETLAVLSAALRDLHGTDTQLEDWTARPITKRGKRRSVRYDLVASGQPYQWVGKFYARDLVARKVAGVLRELAATDCCTRGEMVIPRVVAYHAPYRLLLLTYETGQSVTAAIGREPAVVLPALGRALAALHTTPVNLDAITTPAPLLGGLRKRIAGLCARFPAQTTSLQQMLTKLEGEVPGIPATPALLHGDLGPSQLLWQTGRIVLLDFDRCARGDPALDLGNLLTQLRRLTLRRPGKLPDFDSLRTGILDAYRRCSPADPGLSERVAWYEQVTLLRKIHFLATNTTRHQEVEKRQKRQAEAIQLLEELPALVDCTKR